MTTKNFPVGRGSTETSDAPLSWIQMDLPLKLPCRCEIRECEDDVAVSEFWPCEEHSSLAPKLPFQRGELVGLVGLRRIGIVESCEERFGFYRPAPFARLVLGSFYDVVVDWGDHKETIVSTRLTQTRLTVPNIQFNQEFFSEFQGASERSDATRRSSHTPDKCRPNCQDRPCCPICDGGLFRCVVCGCAEGATTTDCPGRQVTSEELDSIYNGELDFVNGEWVEQASRRSPAHKKPAQPF